MEMLPQIDKKRNKKLFRANRRKNFPHAAKKRTAKRSFFTFYEAFLVRRLSAFAARRVPVFWNSCTSSTSKITAATMIRYL